MKREKYASINNTKKYGSYVLIAIAVVAVCLAGVLYVVKLQEDGGKVYLDTGSVQIQDVEKEKG